MKKTIVSVLILSLMIWTCPVFAITDVQKSDNISAYVDLADWAGFDDVYLREYIEKAVTSNHNLIKAGLKTKETKQKVRLQFGNELPSLSIGAVPFLAKLPGATSTEGFFAVPVHASYELDIFLKNRDKTKSVKKLYEASVLSERAAYLEVVSAVGSCYYNIIRADKLIEIQNKIIDARKEIYEIMKIGNEAGIVSSADLSGAQKAFVLAQSDIFELKKSRDVMLNSLAVLTGDSPENSSSFERTPFDEITLNFEIPERISSDIIERRPDYMISEKMIEKAGIDVRIAKKEFLPSIDILGLLSLGTSTMIPLNSMNWTNAIAGAGASAMLPLFTGFKRIANLKINKIRYEEAMQDYVQTNLTAIKEVNDTLCSLKLDNEKYLKNIEAFNAEKKDFGYTELKHKNGLISKLDLLLKKEALLVTEKLVVSGKTALFTDEISLYKAVAGTALADYVKDGV